LRLPAGTPAGIASVRLSLVAETGDSLAGPLTLEEIEIHAPERSTVRPEIANPVEANFGGVARLLGYDIEPAEVEAGQVMKITLYWEALRPMAESYTVFTHLLDGAGRIRGQHDGLPGGGARPTTSWLAGEVLVDVHELAVDASAPPGEYALAAGLYDAASGARVPVLGAAGQAGADRAALGVVTVTVP
jgi:hypothetical protein